ncbi:hypothetical protein KIPB_010945 [Kipferlia bialata]|uniref:Uncharacterized protein n=1 Tax=Kipferlia bialata TaxID=797122 RepID=A0A9K3GMY6_9EUKA|nr:hypothetical protein KIPB_010945 [Kipferlia bialata]|eukprot:g10945.t1
MAPGLSKKWVNFARVPVGTRRNGQTVYKGECIRCHQLVSDNQRGFEKHMLACHPNWEEEVGPIDAVYRSLVDADVPEGTVPAPMDTVPVPTSLLSPPTSSAPAATTPQVTRVPIPEGARAAATAFLSPASSLPAPSPSPVKRASATPTKRTSASPSTKRRPKVQSTLQFSRTQAIQDVHKACAVTWAKHGLSFPLLRCPVFRHFIKCCIVSQTLRCLPTESTLPTDLLGFFRMCESAVLGKLAGASLSLMLDGWTSKKKEKVTSSATASTPVSRRR